MIWILHTNQSSTMKLLRRTNLSSRRQAPTWGPAPSLAQWLLLISILMATRTWLAAAVIDTICPKFFLVTSAKRVTIDNIDQENRSVNFELVLYNKFHVEIKGVNMSTKTNKLVSDEKIDVNLTQITEPMLVSFYDVQYTYSEHRRDIEKFVHLNFHSTMQDSRKDPCGKVVPTQSRSVSFHIDPKGGKTERLLYYPQTECLIHRFSNMSVRSEELPVNRQGESNLVVAEASALSVSNNSSMYYLFQFTATDKMIVHESEKLDSLIKYSNGTRLGEYNMTELFLSKVCKEKIKESAKQFKTSELSAHHYRSMTSHDKHLYLLKTEIVSDLGKDEILTARFGPNLDIEHHSLNLNMEHSTLKLPEPNGIPEYVLHAMSFGPIDDHLNDARFIYTNKRFWYRRYIGMNFKTIKNGATLDEPQLVYDKIWGPINYVLPKDITHWKRCKKIAAFYGYVYTLHNVDEDIFEKQTEALVLPDLTDYPLVAVHAIEDQFWFLSLNTELVLLYMNSPCHSLSYDRKRIIDSTSLANALSGSVHYMRDVSFYSIKEKGFRITLNSRAPKSEYVTPSPPLITFSTPPAVPEKSNFMTWIYVLCGVVLGVIIIIIIVVQILNSSVPSRPNVVYSRSKDANHGPQSHASDRSQPQAPSAGPVALHPHPQVPTIPPAPPARLLGNQQEVASAMPLLAGESALKTVGSAGSKGSRGARTRKRPITGGPRKVAASKQQSPLAKHSRTPPRHSPSPPAKPASPVLGKQSPPARRSPGLKRASKTPTSPKGSPKK